MNERPLSHILTRLEALGCRPRGHNGTWRAHCPAHDDRRPSLSVTEAEDGKVLLLCRAGCKTEDVLERLGLAWVDLFPDGHQPHNGHDRRQRRQTIDAPLSWWADHCGLPQHFLHRLPIEAEGGHIRFRFGNLPTAKARAPGSKGFWLVRDAETGEWRPKAPDDDAQMPPFWPLPPDHMPPVAVVTEGESDVCVALYAIEALGLREKAAAISITLGSGQRPTPEAIDALIRRGCRALLLVPDVDQAGRDFARRWAEAARQRGLAVAVLDLLAEGLADPLRAEKDLRDGYRRQSVRVMAALRGAIEGLAGQAEAQAQAEARSSGFVPTNSMSVGTKPNREVKATDLQTRAREEGRPLCYLPFLGQEGFIIKGFTHLLSGYAKVGKTELLARVVSEWQEPTLWLTEEPQLAWEARLARLPDAYHHLTIYFALGCPRQELLERIAQGQEAVVIIDTTKLLGIADPDHAGEVTAVLAPVIASCRDAGKTLILVHHERKGGGQHGEGIAGSHAFLAMVDIALELLRDDKSSKRRIIRGYGRIVTVPELCYEMAEDGTLVPLGDPGALALEQVKERVLSLLTEEWQSLKDIMSAMGEPRPSEEWVRRALNALVEEGKAERDPPVGIKGNKPHRWRLAASPFRFDGQSINQNETEPVAQEEGGLPEEERGSFVRQEPPFRFDGQSINRNETEPIGQASPARLCQEVCVDLCVRGA
ncbi:MAG: AAA family ATPase [Dehalococcoidia bacterium]|nr:AAA family ATPase [Dehalococcoidia bacterium]